MHGAGQRIGLGLALEDRDRVPVLREQNRQRQADRATADNHDVRVGRVHAVRNGWWPQALIRS
jgi:TPP-dependent trihydroxycyclohexane-1,2-dione (THcHDO) dehydratase